MWAGQSPGLLLTTLMRKGLYSHFIDEETEAQRN